ncbi:hypothetical protein M4951_03155 [Blastopirellula sp. J2-11]|uniref:hypothetical protein n=1 Tax=Blastopirellula sp. J2-11 TaxID=2943192 RepID=UPI0021C96155|nr:hypothetical protein [Blastopirellula sp. J2-11]UUO07314.1 hypothetical protein M4951_03155 [Blastopirellula sp. J2-11]
MSENWGPCKACKWWQIEPDASVHDHTIGYCIDELIQPFQLRIAGNGGCNRFEAGKPARAAGSSECPPAAAPQR